MIFHLIEQLWFLKTGNNLETNLKSDKPDFFPYSALKACLNAEALAEVWYSFTLMNVTFLNPWESCRVIINSVMFRCVLTPMLILMVCPSLKLRSSLGAALWEASSFASSPSCLTHL